MCTMYRVIICLNLLLLVIVARAQTSPYYFGPNAFPVPDMVETGRQGLILELGGDYIVGSLAPQKDYTENISFNMSFPVFTERVRISIWGQFHEWFQDNEAVRELRGVLPIYPLKGSSAGDAYVSTDIQIFQPKGARPGLIGRIVSKTASGDKYEMARYYDAPGYFYDLTAYNSFFIKENSFIKSLEYRVSAGFLCWQTGVGSQNDALLLQLGFSLLTDIFRVDMEAGRYAGLIGDHDRPAAAKVRVHILPHNNFSPIVYFHQGLNDYPFTRFSLGIRYNLLR